MTTVHKNTCPAFYLDATIDPSGSYSPCTALGGGVFKFKNQSFNTTWMSPVLEDARLRSKSGEQLSMCKRCWNEEELGLVSERNYLIQDLPVGLDYTDKNYYLSGPRHLNIKVSNICNLRCRTCQSRDSYLYHIEGEYYEKKNNLPRTAYTIEKFKKHFTDVQLDELFKLSPKLERIELYGGEPFLDDQIPKFLIQLVDAGLSKNIDLSVSTNATHKLTDVWKKILTNFKEVMINVSIDAVGDKFTYMRHPGNWEDVGKNLHSFFNLEYANSAITVQPVITVSALNVWNIQDVFDYFAIYKVEPFIIMVQSPKYYCVNVLPDSIKPLVTQRLTQYNNPKFIPIINLLNTTPSGANNQLTPWEEFKFWTREKDAYRNENFVETFKDFGKHLIEADEWI
jgi:MoaA/NifB/PqqE/SkfB family radical SAM enzyme